MSYWCTTAIIETLFFTLVHVNAQLVVMIHTRSVPLDTPVIGLPALIAQWLRKVYLAANLSSQVILALTS